MPGGPVYPASPQYPQQPKKTSIVVKIIIGLLVAFGVAMFVSSALLASTALTTCAAVLYDAPTHDSAEAKAFIENPAVTERDLETFDALSGCFAAMYVDDQVLPTEIEEQLALEDANEVVAQYRTLLAQGSWKAEGNYFSELNDKNSFKNPQLWVRTAQLAQDYLQDKTGQRWRIENFSFPFFASGPIPNPAQQHDEEDALVTYLVCESGQDAGLMASVAYYRWADPAYFEDAIDEARELVAERKAIADKLAKSTAMGGRSCVTVDIDPIDVYVWAQGDNDPLRDPDTFAQLVLDVAAETGAHYVDVTLLKEDAPLVLNRRYYTRYANRPPAQIVDPAAAREQLPFGSFTVDVAPSDMLIRQRWTEDPDGKDMAGGRAGELEDRAIQSELPALQIASRKGSMPDNDVVGVVASTLGISAADVIAVSATKSDSFYEADADYTVVIDRSAMPSTRTAFIDAYYTLHTALWNDCFNKEGGEGVEMTLSLYLVEAEGVQGPQGAVSFADMCGSVMSGAEALDAYEPDVVLHASLSSFDHPSYSDYTTDNSPGWGSDFGLDIEGPLANSRAWFLEEYE